MTLAESGFGSFGEAVGATVRPRVSVRSGKPAE
jgi:hypothetical protein